MNPDIGQIFSLLKTLSTQHKIWSSLVLKHKLTFSLQAVPQEKDNKSLRTMKGASMKELHQSLVKE